MSEQDEFDRAAEDLLPCECGSFLHQGKGFHRGPCAIKHRGAVAAKLREQRIAGLREANTAVENECADYDEKEAHVWAYNSAIMDCAEAIQALIAKAEGKE